MNISIGPGNRQFLAENIGLVAVATILTLATPVVRKYAGGYASLAVISLAVFVISVLITQYVVIKKHKWLITDEVVNRTQGVFAQQTDYIELYRIVDYAESQTFLQRFFKVKTVTLISTDKSDPEMNIFGVPAKSDLIKIIRTRVEHNKKEKRIYEITNQ